MKLEKSIKESLRERGKVMIPDLGTFTTSHANAEIKQSGGIVKPPAQKISFSEEIAVGASIIDYVMEKGETDTKQLQLEVEAFTNGVKNNINLQDRSEIKGLGYFKKGSGGSLVFHQFDDVILNPDSFGLPKITARPLVPMLVNNDGDDGDKQVLLKAILIPLIFLALFGGYLLLDKDAYNGVMSYFTEQPAINNNGDLVNPEDRGEGDGGYKDGGTGEDGREDKNGDNNTITDVNDNNGDNNASNDNKPEDKEPEDKKVEDKKPEDKKVEDKKPEDKKPEDKKPEDKKPDVKPSNTGSTNSIITSKTNRYYVIIGSFTDMTSANKALKKCKKIGYKDAKILKVGGKIRVSVADFGAQADAKTKAGQVGKDFPGAWPLKN